MSSLFHAVCLNCVGVILFLTSFPRNKPIGIMRVIKHD